MATDGIAFDMGVKLPNRHFLMANWRSPTFQRWSGDCPKGNIGMLPAVDNEFISTGAVANPGFAHSFELYR